MVTLETTCHTHVHCDNYIPACQANPPKVTICNFSCQKFMGKFVWLSRLVPHCRTNIEKHYKYSRERNQDLLAIITLASRC